VRHSGFEIFYGYCFVFLPSPGKRRWINCFGIWCAARRDESYLVLFFLLDYSSRLFAKIIICQEIRCIDKIHTWIKGKARSCSVPRGWSRKDISLSPSLSASAASENLVRAIYTGSVFRRHDTSGGFAGNLRVTRRIRSWIYTRNAVVGARYSPARSGTPRPAYRRASRLSHRVLPAAILSKLSIILAALSTR